MIDPKQGLTRFSQVYLAKQQPGIMEGVSEMAASAAAAVHETDGPALTTLQENYSISSVEELIALARVAARTKLDLQQTIGITADLTQRLQENFEATKVGGQELASWKRYEAFRYELGCELDFERPPVPAPGRFGSALGPLNQQTPSLPVPALAAPVPPTVNLIDAYMSAIRDQVDRPTCVAFSSVACLEYFRARFGTQTASDLSEQFLYWAMVSKTGQHALQVGFPLLKTDGTCRENTWPYNPKVDPASDDQGPPPGSATPEAVAHRCANVAQLPPRTVAVLKQALSQYRIVAIGIPVYASWFNSAVVRKYGNITVPLPGEVPLPVGHAIALVGYADDPQFAGGGYFIVRNSWDKLWATRSVFGPGYGTIPYRYIELYNWDAWCIIS
ncbi:MAG: C1 family peptidase [Acidobacteriota bacterium]|nr:C1 family peptidase [Acidobacteriota bacterium]